MGTFLQLWRKHRSFMLIIFGMMVFRSAVADWNYVPSSSMNPTLIAGDRVLINKLAYSLRLPFSLTHLARWSTPKRGDVITFDSPADELNLIKRVVAVGGDRVSMYHNTLIINDQEVTRSLLDERRLVPTENGLLAEEIWVEQLDTKTIQVARLPSFNHLRNFDEVIVPEGHVLVLGDSRDNSRDSRFIGFIDVRRVTGQAVQVVLSHDPDHIYIPRSDRWWLPLSL